MESVISIPLVGKLIYPRFHFLLRVGGNDYHIKDTYFYLLAILGGLSLMKSCTRNVLSIMKCFRSEKIELTRRDGPEDFLAKYAVVLGGDTPIGQAFAHELASRRFNIILVGANRTALEATSVDINRKFSVRVTYMHTTVYTDEDLQTFIQHLDVHLKVNDV